MSIQIKNEIHLTLIEMGFNHMGGDMYSSPVHGAIYLKGYTLIEFTQTIYELGQNHKSREIRKALNL
jgi:hypothetical protein